MRMSKIKCGIPCNVVLLCVSVCVLAESEEIKELLSDQGIPVQTVSEVLPVRVLSARILSNIYVRLGKQEHLHLLYLCVCVWVCDSTSKILCPHNRKLQEAEFDWEALQTHWSSGNIQVLWNQKSILYIHPAGTTSLGRCTICIYGDEDGGL